MRITVLVFLIALFFSAFASAVNPACAAFAGDQFQITPNPGNGVYSLTFRSDKRGTLMIAVSDATGKYVFLKTVRDFSGELKENIDITSNPKGIYIFEVESENSREARRVIYQ
jgi:hypothetical protein